MSQHDYNLALVSNINTMVEQINIKGFDIAPQAWYDKMLLDTIKLGTENYVHLKYAETRDLPKGHKSVQLRRWGGLTAHTTPLKEGIPPLGDKTAMESVKVSAMAFGRYMEFTDRVDLDQLDPQLMHYTRELGDVAVRTLEKYARQEMLSSSFEYFANLKSGFGSLTLEDQLTLDELRLLVLKMKRLMVKPLDGYFHFICSPETLHDMITDPLAKEYMQWTGNAEAYQTGKPINLFGIKFVETMLDEFYTPELDHPGEFLNENGEYNLRVYKVTDQGVEYANIPESYRSIRENIYLADGSAIPEQVVWDIERWKQDNGKDGEWYQLPVHRGILLGKGALVKVGVPGHRDAKMIIKGLGSAGSNDPLNQRQTIGFKISSVGFGLLRDAACHVVYSVPSQARFTSHLTADQLVGIDPDLHNITPEDYDNAKQNPLYPNDDELINSVLGPVKNR